MILMIFILLSTSMRAQDQVIIDLNKRSINILINKENKSNYKENAYIEIDTSYRCYRYDSWGDVNTGLDTFFYIKKEIAREKNIISVVPVLYKTSYQLYRQLIGKSNKEKDSILNYTMQKIHQWTPSSSYRRVSYKVTPVQYYQGKFPYIDVYRTY